MESFREFGFLIQIKASEFTELNIKEMKKKKKRNDSGRICRLTLSWKASSTQIRIFLWRIYIYIFTWIGLPSAIPSTHETSESSHRNIRMILQQNGNISWRRESARKGLNTTSGAQLASLPLVKLAASSSFDVPVLLPTKSAYYLFKTGPRSGLRPRQHESR